MNPKLPYITGLQQLNFNNMNNKDINIKKEKNQNEENINNRQIENIINNNQFVPGDMHMGIGGLAGMPSMQGVQGIPNIYLQKNFPQMGYGMNNIKYKEEYIRLIDSYNEQGVDKVMVLHQNTEYKRVPAPIKPTREELEL